MKSENPMEITFKSVGSLRFSQIKLSCSNDITYNMANLVKLIIKLWLKKHLCFRCFRKCCSASLSSIESLHRKGNNSINSNQEQIGQSTQP